MKIDKYVYGTTADEVYCEVYKRLEKYGDVVDSRNGQTKELTHVCMIIDNPTQRWVESRRPVVSPAFAIAELVMIMNGRDDAYLLNTWNPVLPKYQGKYVKYPGAYGRRLRNGFGFDQINKAYETLNNNPNSRQVVMEIWKPEIDLPQNAGVPNNEDIPCNICSLLKIRNNKLIWTQIMRSNDIIFGLPYNFLQFTFLQEIMAGWLGIEVGEYMHISDSLHLYNNEKYYIDPVKRIYLKNEEEIKLCKSDSENVFRELMIRMEELAEKNCTGNYIKKLIENRYLPESYQNMLILLCEYIVYKRNMGQELIQCCEEHISNRLYLNMMQKWMEKRNINN